MNDFDELLRGSLGRLAEPGDPAGVLDAIRSRVEAAGPGGDGGSGGGWLASPWAGPAALSVLALAAAGGGIGLAWAASGASEPAAPAPISFVAESGVDAAACPGGPTVATLDPGARVLALMRSEDGAYLQVRDPAALGTTVWVRTDAATLDAGQDLDALPVGSCIEGQALAADETVTPEPLPTVTTEAPRDDNDPTPTETTQAPRDDNDPTPTKTTPAPDDDDDPTPTETTPPPPPSDTTPPTIQVGSFSPDEIFDQSNTDPGCAEVATITVFASDNVAVTSIVTSPGASGISVTPAGHSGNNWTFTVTVSGLGLVSSNSTSVSFTANDAAGLSSQTVSAPLTIFGSGMCLT